MRGSILKMLASSERKSIIIAIIAQNTSIAWWWWWLGWKAYRGGHYPCCRGGAAAWGVRSPGSAPGIIDSFLSLSASSSTGFQRHHQHHCSKFWFVWWLNWFFLVEIQNASVGPQGLWLGRAIANRRTLFLCLLCCPSVKKHFFDKKWAQNG